MSRKLSLSAPSSLRCPSSSEECANWRALWTAALDGRLTFERHLPREGTRAEAVWRALDVSLPMPNTASAHALVDAVGELHWYYRLLEMELGRLVFTRAEASLLIDVANGCIHFGPEDAQLLWDSVQDGIHVDGLGSKWGLSDEEGDSLVARLKAFTPTQVIAVLDACARFWALPEHGTMDLAESLRLVGLLRG